MKYRKSIISLKHTMLMPTCIIAFMCLGHSSYSNPDEKNVLVLHSYHQGLAWTDSISSGIMSVFNKHTEYNLYVKYLDTKIHNTEDYIKDIARLFYTHKPKIKYSAIIAADNAAYNFLINNRDELYPGIPVFFCGVNFINRKELEQHENFYGFEEIANHKGTIDLIMELLPLRKKILIINDNTLTGRSIRSELEEILSNYNGILDFEFYTSFSIEELIQKVRTLDDDYVIYLLVINKDNTGQFISYQQGIQIIMENTSAPIFGSWDFYLGRGIVGGSITRGTDQGRSAALLALDYLANNNKPVVVCQEGMTMPCLDYDELSHLNISPDELAGEYKIINEPVAFNPDAKVLLIVVIVMAGVLLLSFIYLWFKRMQNNRLKRLVEIRTSELKDINENLRKINQSKNEILGVVAHDLRNPIGNINGFCTVILDQDNKKNLLNKEFRSYLNIIDDLSKYMMSLLNDLLDISVIELGHVKLNLSSRDYVSFIEQEVLHNKAVAERRQLKIEFNSIVPSIELSFDKIKMQQVFINILTNAMKHSKPNDRIFVDLILENNYIVTKIKDTGTGIPESKLQTIFKKFVRLDDESNAKNKGAGLGLSIAKGIIDAHKGSIYVESKVNMGTTFSYKLPLTT
jgi:signal transduction histidine kinase